MRFHYYTTYLAARLVGMEQKQAQRLAYFCQTTDELTVGGDAVSPWYYQGNKFTPCVTGSTVVDDDLGVYHSELAFRRLPAFELSQSVVHTASKVTPAGRHFVHGGVQVTATEEASHAYNPLTDIDWKGGGKIKPSFGQKVAAKLNRFRCQSNVVNDYHWTLKDSHDTRIDAVDERLLCHPNSRFSRLMLNDSLSKTRHDDQPKGIELALLGCRLFVFQRTWCRRANEDEGSGALLQAFYWTLYVIESFIRGKTLHDKLHLSWQRQSVDPSLLKSTLHDLYALDADILQSEFLWLNRIPGLLAYYGISHEADLFNGWDGFRYRRDHLLEQAMVASGGGLSREIQQLAGFKGSDFFQLNKAAEYHANWLCGQLKARSLGFYSTAQSVGEDDLWHL